VFGAGERDGVEAAHAAEAQQLRPHRHLGDHT
jgi:hypothetical protein